MDTKAKVLLITLATLFVCFLAALIVVGAVLAGVCGSGLCSGDDPSSGSSFYLQGRVVHASSRDPIANATISSLGFPDVTSSGNGSFTTLFSASSGVATLSVSATDLVPTVVAFRTKDSVSSYTITVGLATWWERSLFLPRNGTSVDVTSFGRTVTITVKPFDAPDRELYLRVAVINTDSPPGLLESSTVSATTQSRALQSGGMFYYDIVDAITLERQPQWESQVVFNLQPVNMVDIPDSDELAWWHMPSDLGNGTGQWNYRQSINDTLSTPARRARGFVAREQLVPAANAGFWNADRNYRTACVKGKIQHKGNDCPGGEVSATGPDGLASMDHGAADGSFCVTGAQTFQSTLRIGSFTQTITMPSTAGDCSQPSSCRDIGTVVIQDDNVCPEEETPCNGFDCGDGTCINANLVCNTITNCPNGADESPAICTVSSQCCQATRGCPDETGTDCGERCCCCGVGEACCSDWSGCCIA